VEGSYWNDSMNDTDFLLVDGLNNLIWDFSRMLSYTSAYGKFRTWTWRKVSADGGSYDCQRVRAESVSTFYLSKQFLSLEISKTTKTIQ